MSQYYSFDELKDELGLSEDEIKKMVSEGELRAFRDEDTMKFKREDVEALRRQQAGADAGGADDDIILLDEEPDAGGELTDELVLEDDDDFSVGGGTEALDTQDTFVEGEVGGVTEPIDVIEDEEDEADLPPAVTTSSRRMAAPRASASRRIAAAAETHGTPWVTALQIVVCAVMIYAGAFVVGLLADKNTGLTRMVSDFMYEKVHKEQPAIRSLGEGR